MTRGERSKARFVGFLLLGFFLVGGGTSGQEKEFEFDVDAFARKALSLDGYLEFRPSLSLLNRDSAFYLLGFYDRDKPKTLAEGYFALLADLAYRKGIFEAVLEPYLEAAASSSESSAEGRLFQGYLSLKPSPSLTVFAGKRTLRWGKGYAWSPAALVERPKNPNEPDLAREGYWMATADWTKSFGGALKTLSFTPVVMPVSRSVNPAFSKKDGLNFAGKIYLLLFDTDIDLVMLAGDSIPARFGLDFSRNLRSNWEVHGEIAYIRDAEKKSVDADGRIRNETRNTTAVLLGLRYLTASEMTTILEYHHSGTGYRSPDMAAFYSFVDRGYDAYLDSGDDTLLHEAAGLPAFGGFTPMADYFFLRVMQKDPFGILYLNPAATAILNLADGSASWAPEVTYTGITNLELRLKAAILSGGSGDEFGEKRNRFRLELRARYFF
ncbi:MAG: hypothetical protein JXE07_06110 [Candidatus Aminicenantes bacterium]|nr:hypothetical protein [Candidatus Aminicenantes bacterium]